MLLSRDTSNLINDAPISHLFTHDRRTLDSRDSDTGGLYGRKTQEKCIGYIHDMNCLTESAHHAIQLCVSKYSIAKRTLYRWWKHFQFYNEVPFVTREFYSKLRKKGPCNTFQSQGSIFTADPTLLDQLSSIHKSHPEYYLDQFVEHLYDVSGMLVSPSTIYRALHDRLGYRLNRIQEIAANRDDADREMFIEALSVILDDPRKLICIDETAKDRLASRRMRAWCLRGKKMNLNDGFQTMTATP